MKLHATWICGVETWYLIDAKTGELIKKVSTFEEYPKYQMEKRTRKERIPISVDPTESISTAPAFRGKFLITTIDGLGYLVLETKNWEKKWRIPAVSIRAALSIDWPQYSRIITSLDKADMLYENEKSIKKLILAIKQMNKCGVFSSYCDILYAPTVSDDRYLLLSLMNEWKIYDLKTGEWIGNEEEILPTRYTIKWPMGTTKYWLLKKLISMLKAPQNVLWKSVNDNFEPRAIFLPKRKRILIVNSANHDIAFVLDGETGEILNISEEGYDGWPTNPLILALETGLFEEYDVEHGDIAEIYQKDILSFDGYAWGPDSQVVMAFSYCMKKSNGELGRSILLLMILNEKGKLIEHLALVKKEKNRDIYVAYRNGATLHDNILLRDPWIFRRLHWHPKPYIIGGLWDKVVYWIGKEMQILPTLKNTWNREPTIVEFLKKCS